MFVCSFLGEINLHFHISLLSHYRIEFNMLLIFIVINNRFVFS